jgi:HEPN domain-containing protein
MAMRDDAERFLRMARKDWNAAKVLFAAPVKDMEIIGFHAQQAVEKTLKAWLSILDIPFPPTHNLRYLLGLLANAERDMKKWDSLLILMPFAVQFRYEAYDSLEFDLDMDSLKNEIDSLIKYVESLPTPD